MYCYESTGKAPSIDFTIMLLSILLKKHSFFSQRFQDTRRKVNNFCKKSLYEVERAVSHKESPLFSVTEKPEEAYRCYLVSDKILSGILRLL